MCLNSTRGLQAAEWVPRVCVSACAYVLARVGVHLHTCVCGFMRVSQRTNLDVCLRLLTFKDRVSLLFFF